MDDFSVVMISLLVAVACFAVGVTTGSNRTEQQWKQELVDKGYAIYCPLDGEWDYKKGGCDD